MHRPGAARVFGLTAAFALIVLAAASRLPSRPHGPAAGRTVALTPMLRRTLLLLLAAVALAPAAAAAPAIGSVSRLAGGASATLAGKAAGLSAGAEVFMAETIVTGTGARLEITLADRTTLTLGEDARLTLDEFVFDPRAATRIDLTVTGAFRYVSGKLGLGATRTAEVTTPFATIGVRGTVFWGGPIDGHFGVVVLAGTVSVTHRGRTVVLGRPNQGTDLAGTASRPGPVHPWTEPKIDRAIATIAFP